MFYNMLKLFICNKVLKFGITQTFSTQKFGIT
mgnify:CR=1 FL=1|jgi:hypothetical protein